MKTNQILFVLSIVALVFFVVALYPQTSKNNSNQVTLNANTRNNNLKFEDYVCFTTTGATADDPTYGTPKDLGCIHNMLTNGGIGALGNVLNGSTISLNLTRIAIGNGTATPILPSDTTLGGEWLPNAVNTAACGLGNASAVSVGQAQGAWNLTKTFTNTCNSATVNVTALYNQSYTSSGAFTAGNVLFAEANFTTTTLQPNDQINVTWGIYITGTT